MISYTLNGAWGKTIPDAKLKKALKDFGIELEVEARSDGLSNVKINIDDDKILQNKKSTSGKTKTTDVSNSTSKQKDAVKASAKKSTTKRATK